MARLCFVLTMIPQTTRSLFDPPHSIHRCRPPSTITNSINNTMPATTLFDRADFDSVIRTTTSSVMDAMPVKTNEAPSRDVVSPSTSSESVGSDMDDIASLTGVIGTLQLSSSSRLNTIAPSEHKVAENEGRHAVEPLLKDNPNRFVLFPIQDNDVSLMCRRCCCCPCLYESVCVCAAVQLSS